MVNHLLMISADLENLADLQPQGGCDDPNFTYLFKVSKFPPIFHFILLDVFFCYFGAGFRLNTYVDCSLYLVYC